MQIDLSGRIALVTGSTRGIGRVVAEQLLRSGAMVIVCSRTAAAVADTLEQLGRLGPVDGMAVDVSNAAACGELMAFAVRRFGGLDILVNNAVTSVQNRPEALSDDDWSLHLDSKLMAYVRLSRLALPHMRLRSGGRIVNVAGMSARQVTDFRMTNGAVNAAVTNFTKHLSRACGPMGITANVVHPGYTWTPRLEEGLKRWAELEGRSVEAETAARIGEIPIGRFVRPEDIADLVVFLCSGFAAAVTGQVIAVDGGSGQAVTY